MIAHHVVWSSARQHVSSSPASFMRTLARATGISALAIIVAAGVLAAHDMFLRPATHFAAERSTVLVRLLNAAFSTRQNSITRDR